MRARLLARLLVCLGALATAGGALAEPPARTTRTATAPAASTARGKATDASGAKPPGPTAAAYLAGKQALVGLHAPSNKPGARDGAGRAMLSLTNVNRGETADIAALGTDGGFAAADLDRVAHLLRSATGDEHPIDPRTLSLVYRIQTHFDVPEIRVVSGYRLPRAGSRSNHGKGRAVDLIVPGVADEEVARFVRDVGFVGVGVYPVSQFVHVDIRPRSYFWIDLSGPHMKNRERCILADLAVNSAAAAVARGQAPVEPFVLAKDVDAALRARGAAAVASAPPDEDDDDD
jgi:uncharacterized protein YcbK (DUF882 family)